MYTYIDYHCVVCEKTIKPETKIKHLQKITHNELIRCALINHTIENLFFYDTDEICNENITNHNKKNRFKFW